MFLMPLVSAVTWTLHLVVDFVLVVTGIGAVGGFCLDPRYKRIAIAFGVVVAFMMPAIYSPISFDRWYCQAIALVAVLAIEFAAIALVFSSMATDWLKVERSLYWPDRTLPKWTPSWAWLWGNEEDGIDGLRGGSVDNLWWLERTRNDAVTTRIFKWAALRNPANNLRFIRPFGFQIQPSKVKYYGNSLDPREDAQKPNRRYILWFYTTHGLYSGLWLTVGRIEFRIGWRAHPLDAHGLTHDDFRRKGVGFTFQFGRVP